jgi:hypothetical protein
MTKWGSDLAKGIEYSMSAEDREDCFNERSGLDD